MPLPPVVDKNLQRPDFDTFIANNLPKTGASDFPGADMPLGLEGDQGKDPLAELSRVAMNAKPTPLFNRANPIALSEIDTTGRYPFYHPGRDNEDIYASGQGVLSQAASGLLKGLALTGTTLLQGTVGLATGVGAWINDGKFSSFYDNDFNKTLDRFNQYLENEVLPNYYSRKQTDASWYSPDNWFTANFLWDKVIKNLGFAAGAFLSGAAYTKAINAITSSSKLFSIGRAMEAAERAEASILSRGSAIEKLTDYGKNIKGIADKAITKYNILNTGQRVVVAGLSTIGEAGFEAMHNANNFRETSIKEFYDSNGRLPVGEELTAINQQAEEIGNNSFFLNTALLTASNYIQFPRIMGTSYKASKSIANDFAQQTRGIVQDEASGLYRGLKFPKLFSLASRAKYAFNPTEALEEASQYAIQTGTENYYKKQYETGDAEILSDLIGYGWGKVFDSKEGMENLVIGGLSGAVMTARGSFVKNRNLNKATADAIGLFNSNTLTGFMKESVEAIKRGVTLQQQSEEAVRQGDVLEFKDLERDYAHNYLQPRIKYGRFDLVMSDIADAKQLAATEDGFNSLQKEGRASELDTPQTYLQRLNNLENHAKNMQALYESLNLRYKGLINKDGERVYSDEVIDKMVYAASKIADYDARIPQIAEELIKFGINTLPVSNYEIDQLPDANRDAYIDTVAAINKLPVIDSVKDDLKESLDDYIEIGKRRNQFLKEYHQIKTSPRNFKELTDEAGNRVTKEGKKKRTVLAVKSKFDTSSRPKFKGDTRTYEQIEQEYGTGEQSQREVLDKISKSPYATTREQLLAKRFLENTGRDTKIFIGDRTLPQEGISDGTTARINVESVASDYEGGTTPLEFLVLHEVGHNFTINQLRKDQEFRDKIKELMDIAQSKGTSNLYGFKDEYEFATEALSNRKFQSYLATIPYKSSVQNDRSVWTEFIENLKSFIKKALGISDNTLLDEAVAVITNNINLINTETREQIQKEEEERNRFENDKALKDKLNQQQSDLDKKSGVPNDVSVGLLEDGSRNKGADILFRSTTAPSENLRDHHRREQALLNNIRNFKDKGNVRLSIFTPTTENSLGLPGVIKNVMGGDENTIAAIYTKQIGNALHVINIDGNSIGEFGNPIDLTAAIFTTLPTAELVWPSSDKKRYHGSEELAKRHQSAWEKKRAEILSWKGNKTLSMPFNISRGIAKRNIREEEGKRIYEKNPVTTTLVQPSDLDQEGLLQVSTTGTITLNEENINIPIGRAVIVKDDILEYVDNRNLTDNEVQSIYKVLKQFVQNSHTGKVDTRISSYLQGVLYFGRPQEGKTPARNQMWLQEGKLRFGQASIGFYPTAFDRGSEEILDFLRSAYNNVNSYKLKEKIPFEEIYDIDKDGNPVSRTWESYQHFLLSPTYDLVEEDNSPEKGKVRTNIPLTVSVRERNTKVDPNDSNYEQKYATLVGEFYVLPESIKKETPKEAPQETPKKETPVTTGFVLDGKTINSLTTKFGSIPFTAEIKKGETIVVPDISPEAAMAVKASPIYDEIKKEGLSDKDNILQFLINVIGIKISEQLKAIPTATPKEAAPSTPVIIPTDEEAKKLDRAKQLIAEAKKNKDEALPQSDFMNILPFEKNYPKADLDREEKWFEERFNIPFKRVRNMIENGAGGFAYGKFEDAAVHIWENAFEGTTYHEAFHAVWNLFTSPEERKGLLQEFRNRGGQFTDRETQISKRYKDATDKEVREELAEEFRAFILTGKKPNRTKGNWIQRLFADLINFIRGISRKDNQIEEMFQRINKGHYLNAAPINTDPIGPEFMAIVGFNEQITRSVVEGVTSRIFANLFREDNPRHLIEFDEDGASVQEIYNQVFSDLERYYTRNIPALYENNPQELVKFLDVWDNIRNNWPSVVDNVNSYLKTFGIIAKMNANGDTEIVDSVEGEETQDRVNNNETNRSEYERNAFTYDFKKNAPTSVKLLFATLVEVVETAASIGQTTTSAKNKLTALEQQAKYTKIFNQTLSALLTGNTLQEKEQRLRELAEHFPVTNKLWKRLRFYKPNSQVSIEDWRLRVRWFSVMSKQQPTALIDYIDENGNSYTGAAELADAADIVVARWVDALKLEADKRDSHITIDPLSKKYIFRSDSIKQFSVKTVDDALKFLNALGIDFDKAVYDRLNKEGKKEFNKAIGGLYYALSRANGLAATNSRSLDVAGPYNAIAQAYLKGKGDEWDSTYLNIEGEKVQKYILPNFFSNTVNDINNAQNLEELLDKLPQLKYNEFSQNSVFLKPNSLLFAKDGTKNSTGFKIKYIQGTINSGANRPSTPTEKLNPAQRLVQEINQNVQGDYYILVPADSKTEWMIGMGNVVSFKEFDNPGLAWAKIYNIFNKYYQTEKALSVDGKKRLLSDLSDNYKDTEINEGLKTFVEDMVNQQYVFLQEYGMGGDWGIRGLNAVFTKGIDTMDEATVKKILTFRTVNYMINNTEMHKMFFGDPAEYKDPTKRYKSFLSPRESSFYGNADYNNMANVEFNKAGNIALSPSDPGYHIFSDNMNVAIINDIYSYNTALAEDDRIPAEIRNAYKNNNSADAQSWATLPGYREIMKRAGDRWLDAHEAQYQYNMAQDRLAMEQDKLYTYTNPALRAQDLNILAQGNPHSAVFPVLKPIGTGFTGGELIPFLHKTSLVPLSYTLVRDTNLSKLYLDMQDGGISYAIVTSGEKVGNRPENTVSVYDEQGNFVRNDFGNTFVNIPHQYYGIQVETSGQKDKQTRGSQLTKLAIINLLEGGVPVDVREQFSLEAWDKLTEGEKEAASKVYREVRLNIGLLNKMTEHGYQQLLNKFGITDHGTHYTIKDKRKIAKLLQDEMLRREVAENFKEALSLDENGNFNVPLEATPNYGQIKAILYSQVDRYLGSPKLNGGPKIQVSGAMWEKVGARETKTVDGKTVYVSKGLKFYQPTYNEDGTVKAVGRMEIMLPNWIARKLRKKGFDPNDPKIYGQFTKAMLNGIGFRIPTQEMNSIEAFTIKGFLPEEFGDTVIVPEEITTKAGSDFDVDKLMSYLNNIHITNTGQLHLVEYKGTDQETRDYYSKFFDDAITASTDKANEELDAIIDEGEDMTEQMEERAIFLQKKLTQLSDAERIGIQRDIFVERMFGQALENEYFNSLGRLILAPRNFLRLITPNTSKELQDLRDDLNSILGREQQSRGGILNPLYMSQVRHNFIVGKGGVGIAAVQQTNNALSQIANVHIDPDRLASLPSSIRTYIPDVRIALPHNTITKDGKTMPTLSGITDQSGRYISDKISQYINGYVDISKDAFIVEIGANPTLASTFMLLEKLGVPTDTVVYFMNQPIIREYVKSMENDQQTWLFNKDRESDILGLFSSKGVATDINTKTLRENIRKFYLGKGTQSLTDEELAEQRFILSEFLKYAMMARQLFEFTQGSNYDTANFSDPNLFYRKNKLTQNARINNIFNSVDNLLTTSHVGRIGDRIGDITDALGETVIPLQSVPVRQVLNRVIDQLTARNMGEKQYMRAARKVEESFLSYMIQTKQGVNNRIRDIMLDSERAVAVEIAAIQKEARKNPSSDLANNFFLNSISPLFGDNQFGTKNIALAIKVSEAYTSNQLTGALRELKGARPELYGRIIRLAFLQSGVSKSPISFTEFIPHEDYAKVIQPVINQLVDSTQFSNFADVDAFFRSNWKDDTIVPRVKDKHIVDYDNPIEYTDPTSGQVFLKPRIKSNRIFGFPWIEAIKDELGYGKTDRFYPYKVHSSSLSGRSKFILVNRIKAEFKDDKAKRSAMAKKKDFSFVEQILLRRVDSIDGNPIETPYEGGKGTYFTYMPVNAWGDGFKAQEYYTAPRESQFNNGTYKVKAELENSTIINYMEANSPRVKKTPAGGDISMLPENMKKVVEGTKTTTIRTELFEDGVFHMTNNKTKTKIPIVLKYKDDIRVVGGVIKGKTGTIELDSFAKGEGFSNWQEFVKNNSFSKNFVNGSQSRYLYSIEPVENKCS